MSALGQKQTFSRSAAMSAIPPKADIAERHCDVRFVPKAEVTSLLDHLVGGHLQRQRQLEAECLGRLEVDEQLEPGRLHHG
jgi:hypothetical protein